MKIKVNSNKMYNSKKLIQMSFYNGTVFMSKSTAGLKIVTLMQKGNYKNFKTI